MSQRCVDASLIVKLALKGEPHRSTCRRLVRESTAAGIELIAPPLFESEVDTVICKRVAAGKLSLNDAHQAYNILDRAPVRITTHASLRQRAREIAESFNLHAVYDATYAASEAEWALNTKSIEGDGTNAVAARKTKEARKEAYVE